MITTTHFRHPRTGATATVVVYPTLGAVVAKAYIGTTVTPRWEERISTQGSRQLAAESAQVWAGLYALRLTNDFHMEKVA